MAFRLPDLPFGRDALGQFMSGETLDYHHGKHHKAYVDKTNGWIDAFKTGDEFGSFLTEQEDRVEDTLEELGLV